VTPYQMPGFVTDPGKNVFEARERFVTILLEVVPEARERFEKALGVTDSLRVRETAILGLARLHTEAERWKEGERRWIDYLDEGGWTTARAEANHGYARCLDGQGKSEEALQAYISVYANFPGDEDRATSSYLRASELLWNSGRQLDALKVLQDMLRRMKGSTHPNFPRAEDRFFEWRDEYVASQNP